MVQTAAAGTRAALSVQSSSRASLFIQHSNKILMQSLDNPSEQPKELLLKRSVAKHFIKMVAVDKLIVVCFKKLLVFVSSETFEIVHVEPLAHVYDVCVVDHKTIAVSCRLAEHFLVCTYSTAKFAPLSSCAVASAVKSLFCLPIG